MERVDVYPTFEYKGYKLRHGTPLPFGATVVPGGVNFSISSRNAKNCTLVLYQMGEFEPLVEIPFRGEFSKIGGKELFSCDFRIGDVFNIIVFGLNIEEIEYGFRMSADYPKPEVGKPAFHRFDPTKILLDPYAKAIGGRDVWRGTLNYEDPYQHRARIMKNDFDWGTERPLEIPIEDLVIYEMHVRGFTKHPSSKVKHPGTFRAVCEKIPYLKELGVNCIELMPICEFDEYENSRLHPDTGELLLNYWGYSTVGFFAPKSGYASLGKNCDGSMVADELKAMIRELHQNGIEVILDIVFNHTAEGNEFGPTISFRGIDNVNYYMLTPEGYYYNFSGTGNTFNCNNPIARNMVLDCLRYWAAEYHVDGFRFDLASILGRAPSGEPLSNPPLLESLAYDPILSKCKLIAEAWDAGGLYQVGSFPAYGRWTEWNGKYRDDIRNFIKGERGVLCGAAQRIQGSPDLYSYRNTTASLNFVTCHDGFTLFDLVSYNEKHNEANGEYNQDGTNDNNSWNCGAEGETTDVEINFLRQKQIRNFIAILIVSWGIPMILMGDEMGHSQQGNNNAYCHDSELSWLDWKLLEKHASLFRFVKYCIQFRKEHPILRRRCHFGQQYDTQSGYVDISWHGVKPWWVDWSRDHHTLAFMLARKYQDADALNDNYIYVAMNMHWEDQTFEFPELPEGLKWHLFVNTGENPPEDVWEPGKELLLDDSNKLLLAPRSVCILVGK